MTVLFKKVDRSESRLATVFWLYGGVGMILPFVVVMHALWLLKYDVQPATEALRIAIMLGFIVYFACWSTMLWRRRRNVVRRIWSYLAGTYYLGMIVLLCFFGSAIIEVNVNKNVDEDPYLADCSRSPDSGCIEQVLAPLKVHKHLRPDYYKKAET